jgi:iron complex transport system substrate-binding protein
MTRIRPARHRMGLALLGLGIVSCGGVVADTLALTDHAAVLDDRGRAIASNPPPTRIVTLLPSLTETVCELGACSRIVGTDRYSNWPPLVRSLPKVGGLEDPSLERIVALHPDVVLASRSSRVIDRLDELGIPVVALEANTIGDVRRVLVVTATLLGDPAAGVDAWQRLQTRIKVAAAQIPPVMRGNSVYFEVSEAPYAAGASSFIGELLGMLGMSNAVPGNLGPFPKLNPEFIVRVQPSIVMTSEREFAGMRDRPGWSGLRALQLGRICAFPAERFEVLIRPGPRLGEAANMLSSCLVKINSRGAP